MRAGAEDPPAAARSAVLPRESRDVLSFQHEHGDDGQDVLARNDRQAVVSGITRVPNSLFAICYLLFAICYLLFGTRPLHKAQRSPDIANRRPSVSPSPQGRGLG